MPLLEQLACSCVPEIEKRAICHHYFDDSDEFYFDRSDKIFESVLDYYRTEKLHCPTDICPQTFITELEFWKIDPQLTASCCYDRLGILPNTCKVTICDETKDINQNLSTNGLISDGLGAGTSIDDQDKDIFEGIFLGNVRKKLWDLMDNPQSSRLAMVFIIISAAFVFLSILGLILGSMKQFQKLDGDPKQFLEIIETCCVAWFTFDYCFRLLIVPNRWEFVKTPLNIVDLLAVIPFYIELSLSVAGVTSAALGKVTAPLLMMRMLRVLRVARIFKLARYSGGLKTFGASLSASRREIGMLMMFIGTNVLVSSTIVYYFEKDEPSTKFESIPHAFWWCIITMTTVGYGDITPQTLGGRLVASFTSVSGVIVLAFPITIIVENFNKNYKRGVRDNDSIASGVVRRGFRGIAL